MSFNADLAAEQLAGIYQRSYDRILERVARKTSAGNVTAYERTLLRDIDAILAELDTYSQQYVRQVIPKSYRQSQQNIIGWMNARGLPIEPVVAGFGGVHRAAIDVLAQNMYDNLRDANNFVGRRIRDQWRRVQLEVTTETLAEGRTLREARRRLLEVVADEGLGSFRDAKGRVWRMDSYAKMVSRSTTREATNLGRMNQLRELGRDLVQFSSHSSPCEICAPLENRVYSMSGEDTRYPKLDVAFGDYANIHPNCKHSVSPYVEDLDDNPEQTREQSNRPFDEDPRSAAEVAQYEREQEQNRQRLDRRKAREAKKAEEV